MEQTKRQPLEGIRVVEFTTSWVGPGGGMLLCEMGAEVIRIENPTVPCYWRRTVPAFFRGEGLNRSGLFAIINRGKKSCVLDLKQPESIQAVKQLITISDIVVTNFAPRVMESLGLGYSVLSEMKPDIIMVAASGYGATGPDRGAVAFGVCLEPYCGLSSMIGYPDGPPLPCGTTLSDLAGQVGVAFTSLVALHHRELTGKGQYIDISEVENLIACTPEAVLDYSMNHRQAMPNGNKDQIMVPHGTFRCKGEDKWAAIAVRDDEEWKSLCRAMGKPELAEDERFKDGFLRKKNEDELHAVITEWTEGKTNIEVMELLQKAGIACGPVYNGEEIYNDPHLRAREFFFEHDHPEVGKKTLPGVFARFSETPDAIGGSDPLFGEHTEWVLRDLLGIEK